MNKHSIIVIVSSLVIIGAVAFPLWNIFAVTQLRLHGTEGTFRFYEFMTNEDHILMCNDLPFPTSFNQFDIDYLFEGVSKGVFHISGETIFPHSSMISEGKFTSETFSEAQYLAMNFDSMFQGDAPIRIDPKKLTIDTDFRIMILGVIPYTITHQYSGIGFYNMLNEDTAFDC